MQIIETQSIRMTEQGLVFGPAVTREESVTCLKQLLQIEGVLEFALGDWIAHHEQSFGQDSLREVLTQVEFDWVRSLQAKRLSSIPHTVRRPTDLSAKHHLVVSTATVEEQQYWLGIAVEHSLAPTELARSYRKGALVTKEELQTRCATTAGRFTPHSIQDVFERWVKQLGSTPQQALEAVRSWPVSDQLAVWDALKGTVAFGEALSKFLEGIEE